MFSNEQPKTKKQRTSTTQIELSLTSTSTPRTKATLTLPRTHQSTEIATAPIITKLDTLPDEILLHISMYTGAHSCYLGYGAVNKRLNQIFNTYSNKLSKSTSHGGYAPFQEITEKCETELKREKEYDYWIIPKIFHNLASGAVTFNRTDLLEWALEKQNKYIIFREICERALRDEKLPIFQRVWKSVDDENLMTYMKENTHFIHIVAWKGFLDWLTYLREELECKWNENACSKAAHKGHLECLTYLWNQYHDDLGPKSNHC